MVKGGKMMKDGTFNSMGVMRKRKVLIDWVGEGSECFQLA